MVTTNAVAEHELFFNKPTLGEGMLNILVLLK